MVISQEYRAEQQRLHFNPRYGVASTAFAPLVQSILWLGDCRSLSDYGAGKCNLKVRLGLGSEAAVSYNPYDPAFPNYGPPKAADLVTCIDVLEHIEPEYLDTVLDEIASITDRLALLTIHTGPAKKTLSDGRNAHLIQEQPDWWAERLASRFDLIHVQVVRKGFFVVAAPLGAMSCLPPKLIENLVSVSKRARPRSFVQRLASRWAS